jgi:hypothetical protein
MALDLIVRDRRTVLTASSPGVELGEGEPDLELLELDSAQQNSGWLSGLGNRDPLPPRDARLRGEVNRPSAS